MVGEAFDVLPGFAPHRCFAFASIGTPQLVLRSVLSIVLSIAYIQSYVRLADFSSPVASSQSVLTLVLKERCTWPRRTMCPGIGLGGIVFGPYTFSTLNEDNINRETASSLRFFVAGITKAVENSPYEPARSNI